MATTRRAPYVWVTWLARYLAGETSCPWAAWFKSHYQAYTKVPSDFNQAAWNADHAALVQDRTAALRAVGYRVTVEDQNAFRLLGGSRVTLAGKADLIGIRGDTAVIEDVKTGTPRTSDVIQVQIYLAVFPHMRSAFRELRAEGRLQYREQSVDVPTASVDATFVARLRDALPVIGGPQAPVRVPSVRECNWCDISQQHCEDRLDGGLAVVTNHGLF